MKTLLKYLGAIIFLAGVACLVAYFLGNPTNTLLVCSLALEFVGLVAYTLINKFVD